MTPRALTLSMLIVAAIEVVIVAAFMAHGELPAGMHLASAVRVDTVIRFYRTPASRMLDSLIRADSVAAMRRHDSLKRLHDAIRPRQRLNRQDSVWLKWKR